MPAKLSGRAAALLAAAALSLPACAPTQTGRPSPPARPSPVPHTTPRTTPTPPPVPEGAPRETGAGAFEQFKFSYAKTGEQTVADFRPLGLPRAHQNAVVAAARKVIERAYGERLETLPRLVAWDYNETKHAVRLEGASHDYVFVPVRDGDKDISRVVIWRVEKGTVR